MKVAIVGATGEVGRMMITCLEESNLKVSELDLFASYRSAGTILYYTDQPLTVQELKEDSLLTHYDYVLFLQVQELLKTMLRLQLRPLNW